MRFLVVLVGLVLFLAQTAAAQAPVEVLAEKAGVVPVRATLSPCPPGVGSAHLVVDVDDGGPPPTPIPGFTRAVSVILDMPSMPAMKPTTAKLQPTGATRFEGDVEFSMEGPWRMRVVVGTRSGDFQLVAPIITVGDAAAPPPRPSPTATPAAAPETRPITITSLSVPPRVGENPLRLDVPGDVPAGDAVYVAVDMPGMAMAIPPVEARRQPDGSWLASVQLTMSGLWHVNAEAGPFRGQATLTVPAAAPPRPSGPLLVATLALAVPLIAWTLLRRRAAADLVAGALLLASTFLAGTYIERRWPPDTSMGMTMDMARPDMGMGGMAAPLPVLEARVQRLPLIATRVATGRVLPGREQVVAAPRAGMVTELAEVGQAVSKGQALATVGGVPVPAPLSGVVVARHVDRGDRLAPGLALLTIGDVRTVRVRARAGMADMEAIVPGTRVDVIDGERTGVGRVALVSHLAEGAWFDYEAIVDNVTASAGGMGGAPARRSSEPMTVFWPGQDVAVRTVVGTRPPVLSVPLDAVVREGDRRWVFRLDARAGQLIAHRCEVTTGLSTDTHVEIVSGLREGDRVAAASDPSLRDGVVVTPGTWASGAWRALVMPRDDAMHAP